MKSKIYRSPLVVSIVYTVLVAVTFFIAKNAVESKMRVQIASQLQADMDDKLFSDEQYVTSRRLIDFYIKEFNSTSTKFTDIGSFQLVVPNKIRLDYVQVALDKSLPSHNAFENAFHNKLSTTIRVKGIEREVLFSYQYALGLWPLVIFVLGYFMALYFWSFKKVFQ